MASVMSRCVLGVVSLVCARHAQHFVLQNGSVGPKIAQIFRCAENKKGLFIAKGGGAAKKGLIWLRFGILCERGVSRVRATHAQLQFCSTKWQYRPRNCSNFPLRGLTRRGLFIAKGGARAEKSLFFFLLFGVFQCSRGFWCTC